MIKNWAVHHCPMFPSCKQTGLCIFICGILLCVWIAKIQHDLIGFNIVEHEFYTAQVEICIGNPF